MSNLEKLVPSKKRLRPGDVFVLKLRQVGYLWGRVIRTNEELLGWPEVNLVYIYKVTTDNVEIVPELETTSLLMGPVVINRLGWSRGFLQTVAHTPLEEGDLLEAHCFYDPTSGHFYDEKNRIIKNSVEPHGIAGLDSYRSLEDAICLELGIPTAPPDE